MTRSQDERIQNGGNNCFVPIADAGYLSVQVIQQFFFDQRISLKGRCTSSLWFKLVLKATFCFGKNGLPRPTEASNCPLTYWKSDGQAWLLQPRCYCTLNTVHQDVKLAWLITCIYCTRYIICRCYFESSTKSLCFLHRQTPEKVSICKEIFKEICLTLSTTCGAPRIASPLLLPKST